MASDGKGFTLARGLKDGRNENSGKALEAAKQKACKSLEESTTVEESTRGKSRLQNKTGARCPTRPKAPKAAPCQAASRKPKLIL
jgi:hypothetical protein